MAKRARPAQIVCSSKQGQACIKVPMNPSAVKFNPLIQCGNCYVPLDLTFENSAFCP
jgi:hypothetical protein